MQEPSYAEGGGRGKGQKTGHEGGETGRGRGTLLVMVGFANGGSGCKTRKVVASRSRNGLPFTVSKKIGTQFYNHRSLILQPTGAANRFFHRASGKESPDYTMLLTYRTLRYFICILTHY